MNLSLFGLYSVLPTTLPYLGLAAIGIYFAVARREAHPKASLFASLGFLCLIIKVFGHAWLTVYTLSNGTRIVNRAAFGLWYGTITSALEVMELGGLVLLTVAIFANRQPGSGGA